MKIRVISYDSYEDWYEEKFREGDGKPISELTDKEFMEIYNDAGGDCPAGKEAAGNTLTADPEHPAKTKPIYTKTRTFIHERSCFLVY